MRKDAGGDITSSRDIITASASSAIYSCTHTTREEADVPSNYKLSPRPYRQCTVARGVRPTHAVFTGRKKEARIPAVPCIPFACLALAFRYDAREMGREAIGAPPVVCQ